MPSKFHRDIGRSADTITEEFARHLRLTKQARDEMLSHFTLPITHPAEVLERTKWFERRLLELMETPE